MGNGKWQMAGDRQTDREKRECVYGCVQVHSFFVQIDFEIVSVSSLFDIIDPFQSTFDSAFLPFLSFPAFYNQKSSLSMVNAHLTFNLHVLCQSVFFYLQERY